MKGEILERETTLIHLAHSNIVRASDRICHQLDDRMERHYQADSAGHRARHTPPVTAARPMQEESPRTGCRRTRVVWYRQQGRRCAASRGHPRCTVKRPRQTDGAAAEECHRQTNRPPPL